MTLVGIISDTHGLVRPEALDALRGVDRILHAGDVCGREVLEALSLIAPIDAVRGNIDLDPFGRTLPFSLDLVIEGVRVHLVHDRDHVDREADVVVTGHSHMPLIERVGSTLFVNPGSAGPRRYSLPITVARLRIEGGAVTAEIVAVAGE